jgi:hypothetical protein
MMSANEQKPVKIKIFTDRNLIKIVSQGWDLDRLVSGKIGTLTGRNFYINLPNDTGLYTTIKVCKGLIEDQEGIPIQKQEIRKGSKKLDDEKTLRHYLVNETDTLLLLVATDDYDKYLFHPQEEESIGMKVKMKPQVTQTLTIDEETASKLPKNDGNWWNGTSMLSGPQNVRRTTTTSSSTGETTQTTTQSATFERTLSGNNASSIQNTETPDLVERRRQIRLATERRLKGL